MRWNFHGVVVVVRFGLAFLECSSQVKLRSKILKRILFYCSLENVRCVVHASLSFRISHALTQERKGKGWRKPYRGGLFSSSSFFFFFFTCFSTPRSIKFALPVIVLYCIGRIMHVAYISRRKECTCGCTYLLSSRKMSREGDMFDFASLGTDNCLQRSSFCKGDGCNGNSYTMHFAQWNNCICIPFN